MTKALPRLVLLLATISSIRLRCLTDVTRTGEACVNFPRNTSLVSRQLREMKYRHGNHTRAEATASRLLDIHVKRRGALSELRRRQGAFNGGGNVLSVLKAQFGGYCCRLCCCVCVGPRAGLALLFSGWVSFSVFHSDLHKSKLHVHAGGERIDTNV